MRIANNYARPSIPTVAKECAAMKPKKVVTFTVTPFDSVSGNTAYEKEFTEHFQATANTAELIHVPPFADDDLFVDVFLDRVETAYHWLAESVRADAEIIFTVHSRPGTPKDHQKMIEQYERLALKVADSLAIKNYHLAYRSGNPHREWLAPDVMDLVSELHRKEVPAIVFVEALSVVSNMEVLQEITQDAIETTQDLGIVAIQSEYLNDSADFVLALFHYLLQYTA